MDDVVVIVMVFHVNLAQLMKKLAKRTKSRRWRRRRIRHSAMAGNRRTRESWKMRASITMAIATINGNTNEHSSWEAIESPCSDKLSSSLLFINTPQTAGKLATSHIRTNGRIGVLLLTSCGNVDEKRHCADSEFQIWRLKARGKVTGNGIRLLVSVSVKVKAHLLFTYCVIVLTTFTPVMVCIGWWDQVASVALAHYQHSQQSCCLCPYCNAMRPV